jgi:hypothetical protein
LYRFYVFLLRFVNWILELFRQCGIFDFHFITISPLEPTGSPGTSAPEPTASPRTSASEPSASPGTPHTSGTSPPEITTELSSSGRYE